MVILDFVTTVLLWSLDNRIYIQHLAGPPGGLPYTQNTLKGEVVIFLSTYLDLVGFLLTHLLNNLTYKHTSSSTSHRSWNSRTTSQVSASGTRANRGPKSPARERSPPLVLFFATTVLYLMVFVSTLNPNATPWRPEGSDAATGISEAHHIPQTPSVHWAKQSGIGPLSTRPDVQPFSRKKSFLRALKRAQLHGMTWYRGKLYSASMLGTTQIDNPRQVLTNEKSTGPQPQGSKLKANRFSGFNWNIGALSNYKLDILKTWMLPQPLSILTIQDTRWGFTGDWMDDHFAYIHSGSNGWAGGVLTIVRRSFCPQERISWREVKKGRILHVRLYMSCTSIDILNVYQHAWSTQDQACLSARSEIWQLCDHALKGLPGRNVVVLAGDWNTGLDHIPHCVGLSDFSMNPGRHRGPRHPDSGKFGDLIRRHGLIALNTWDTTLGPTYLGNRGSASRIDYILVRHKTSDSLAKHPIYLDQLPLRFGHLKDHIPMLYNIPYKWRAWKTPCRGLPKVTKSLLQQHWELDSDHWTSWISELSDTVRLLHDQAPSIENLNYTIMEACKQFRPPTTLGTDTHALRHPRPRQWSHGHPALRDLPEVPLAATLTHRVFVAWFRNTQVNRWRRTTKNKAREAKRLKLTSTIEAARHLWAMNKSHQYFKLVHTLTPKTHAQRPQLRRSQGNLMSPQEELDWITQYMQELYQGSDLDLPPFGLQTLPFQDSDLTRALQSISSHTGVPQHIAPSFVWKALAAVLGPLLTSWCSFWLSQGHIPDEWRRGWVVLLPKPNKPPTEPKALRPIALQTPLSKTIMSLFVQHAKLYALPGLVWYPQFAYLPGRGTWEAIARVTAHVREVQTLLARWKYDANAPVNDRATRPKVYGGCQLFLDLTGAFDAMPREHLRDAFRLLQLPEDIILLLLTWHTETAYIVQWKGLEAEQPTYKGIRQGCRGAPFFWACFIALILDHVAAETDVHWMRKHCTFYADDGHACFVFHSWEELQRGLTYLGRLINILERLGMKVNMTKSAAIIQWRGPDRALANKAFVRQSQHGASLRIPKEDNTQYEIPLREHQEYLGISVGYKQMLRGTMQKRLNACIHRHRQMKPWFCNSLIHTAQKLSLWETCVLPIALYGLDSTGVDQVTLPQFSKTLLPQLRQVMRDHQYISHTKHADFLTGFNLKHPVTLLRDRMAAQLSRHEARLDSLAQDDIVLELDTNGLQSSLQLINTWLQDLDDHDLAPSLPLAEAGLDCTRCGLTFRHLYTLRRHEMHSHGIVPPAGPTLDIARDSINGKPVCRHCGDSFISWQNLTHHIQNYACPSFDSSKAPPEQLQAHRRQLLAYHDQGDLQPLRQDRELCYFLSQRCILCGFWSARLQQMSAHMGRDHPDAYNLMHEVLPNVTRARMPSPCELCGQEFKSRTHTCPVKKQLGLALADRRHRAECPESPPPVPQPAQRMDAQFTCATCQGSLSPWLAFINTKLLSILTRPRSEPSWQIGTRYLAAINAPTVTKSFYALLH